MADTDLRPVLLRLPPDLRDKLRARAVAEERTMAAVVRRALRLYLQRPPPDEPFGMESEATGRRLGGDDRG